MIEGTCSDLETEQPISNRARGGVLSAPRCLVPTVSFTSNIQRHVACPVETLSLADTQTSDVQGVLRAYFARHPLVQSYILDEQGQLRKHVTIFLNGVQIRDRDNQRERVALGDEIVVMQALSGG